MVVGQRDETIEEKTIRHYKEMKNDIEGWENELQIAKKLQDKKYEKFCVEMIQICENTILHLEKFASENYIALSK